MSDHRLWPGKGRPLPEADQPWHPATFHCLDVMACAVALMNDGDTRMQRVASAYSFDLQSLKRAFALLIGLHDLGKLSEKFAHDFGHQPPESRAGNRRSHLRHWQISYALMTDDAMDEAIAQIIGIERPQARWQLYSAVSGHHGCPPDPNDFQNFNDLVGMESATSFLEDIDRLLPPAKPLGLKKKKEAARLSWTLAGLTVVADWVGSNQCWFPYTSPTMDVAKYWSLAQQRADNAITQAGLRHSALSEHTGLKSLFGIEKPRPMQAYAEAADLSYGPMLAVIEDVTGSGKTESALVLAQRMLKAGKGEGVYVALPTLATANAMFDRLGSSYRKLFDVEEEPSIALAHAQRQLNQKFRDAIAFSSSNEAHRGFDFEQPNSIDEQSVAAACNDWVADDKRKVFLSDVGIGTIDQGFLSILPVRFSALRLWGLGQRILIVDEAHACDSYMKVELERLLAMQASLGGSAIVLTATLTKEQKRRLSQSFRRGLGQTDALNLNETYPSLTVISADTTACNSLAVDSLPQSKRSVKICRLESEEELLNRLSESANAGCACVWIRNTVDQAIAAATALRTKGHCVDLFHARFAMGDRLRIEQKVLSIFGKTASSETRRGRILIATQVVEQSLDLDFDWMASDLAPVDMLIQRAGRLWRHMDLRPAAERPCAAQVLHVLSADPDIVENKNWARSVIGEGGWVYDTATLWRTARAIFDAGSIDSPDGLPSLLERVAGDRIPDVPIILESEAMDAEGQRFAATAIGVGNVVVIDEGYAALGGLSPESKYPTRLGQPTISVFLVRKDSENELIPWVEAGYGSQQSSTISVSRRRFERFPELEQMQHEDQMIVELKSSWPDWQKASVAVVIVKEGGSIISGVRYDADLGLCFECN